MLLAGLGAGLLLVIGFGALTWLMIVRPLERLGPLVPCWWAAGEFRSRRCGWRRRDAAGVLAADARRMGVTMRARNGAY